MEHINKALDAFFANKEANVLVFKGDWGVGKTYFWNQYITEKIEDKELSQVAYSYISLFGNSTLQDVRKSVFRQAKPISIEKVDKAFENEYESTMLGRMMKKSQDFVLQKATNSNGITSIAEYLPITSKYASAISALEYNLVNNYVVCIDDIERKGDGLPIKEIMGWVDELSQRKSCKVILIFNENSFDDEKDKNNFEAYREKVVDYEVTYSPTCEQNISYVFGDDFAHLNQLKEITKKLELKNVRILKKIKWAYGYFEPYLKNVDEHEVKKFVLNLVVHCYVYFEKNNELPYDEFIGFTESFSFLLENVTLRNQTNPNEDKQEPDTSKENYKQLILKLNYLESDFKKFISLFLKNGYLDEVDFNNFLTKFNASENVRLVGAKLEIIWDELYSNSFDDNFEEFYKSLKSCILENIEHVHFRNFCHSIDIFDTFGKNEDELIFSYVSFHSKFLAKLAPKFREFKQIKNSLLREQIEILYDENKKLNIDDVALNIFEDSGWDDEILIFLNSLSEEYYFQWMKNNPEQMVRKIRGGLLIFSPSDEPTEYASIGRKVHNTLKRIASENDFNAYRIEHLYGITKEK